jgi:hypothetical protein
MMETNSRRDGARRSPFEDLFRLQSEFQNRLAEETVKYLRQLQGMVGPVVPGTVVMPESDGALGVRGAAGESVALTFEIENRQRVHAMVTPMLSPLVGVSGITWFAEAEASPVSFMLAPDEKRALTVRIGIGPSVPAGEYRGALLLYGFREGAIPVTVAVTGAARSTGRKAASAPRAAKRRKARRASARAK